MIKKEINFSDLVDFFRKNDVPTFDEEIDKFGGYFITAARIAAVIIAPDPVSKITVFCAGIDAASLRASKLFDWLPDKFKYKDREKFAIDRYEICSYANFILLQIAIKNGVKEIIMPQLQSILGRLDWSDEEKKQLKIKCEDADKEFYKVSVPTFSCVSNEDIHSYSLRVIDLIISTLYQLDEERKGGTISIKKIELSKLKEQYCENVTRLYQTFLINFSSEFTEFALWADINYKAKIIKELKEATSTSTGELNKFNEKFTSITEKLIARIEELRDNSFIPESGFPSFIETYKKMFIFQEQPLLMAMHGKIIDNIKAHQNYILNELDNPLSKNTDVEQIVYPLNKDIYISQSFEAITYKKKEHRRVFLTKKKLSEQVNSVETGENIGNYLLKTLVDPNYASKPIILLGNPGAGKSMLSRMFAGLLCDTNDFIPFLIKLRSVASSSGNISEHISKGLSNTIANVSDVNWIEWAKEFKNRIPVIIMDGFDELMQTSNRELNGYVDAIREFQEKALNSGICARIILTSRISVMQDVFIPEHTKIIKLDSFDPKRRNLWIQKWNDVQIKPKHRFAIPKNDKIELLAEEPLILFMLAVYDFENNELQNMASDKSFNQSKLYDSLLERFIKRQLEKDPSFKDLGKFEKDKEKEMFMLRLGMIALMMFLNDTTSRDTQKLLEEMSAFGINKSCIPVGNILGGFFFIHENQSKTEGDVDKFNYEFLHKTFGEFLAADFILRVAKKQYERMIENNQELIAKKETFNFCFGYNWLHKHNNIQNFLFEHAKQIVKPDSTESKFIINTIIRNDLSELFEKGHHAFPVTDIRLLEKKTVIEHLGIYSQNIIFLWMAIVNDKYPIKFEIFDVYENIGEAVNEPKYESQDRDEINKNKLLWKRLTKLWTLVGNYSAAAKLTEWVNVNENGSSIELRKIKGKVIHNFSDSANVGCNDFELLLSYFDNEYKFLDKQNTLNIISGIITKKTELFSLAVDVVLHRFHDLYSEEGLKLFEWFFQLQRELNKKQQVLFVRKTGMLKWQIDSADFAYIISNIPKEMPLLFNENIQAITEYFKILVEIKSHFPFYEVFNPEFLDDTLYKFSRELGRIESDNPLSMLEYIRLLNEISKIYPFKQKVKIDFLEESLHRLNKDMRHFVRENTYAVFEYLRLVNELSQSYPIRKIYPEFLDEAIHILSRDAINLVKYNPHAILEYLKLLSDLKEHFPINERFPQDFFIESLRYITKEWEVVFRDNHLNFLEYLKILSEFGKKFSMSDYIPYDLIREAFHRLPKDMFQIISDNPKEAQVYLEVIKQYYITYLKSNDRFTKNIFDEPLFRFSKEMDKEFSINPQTFLIYLELILISYEYGQNTLEQHIIERLIDLIRQYKKDYPYEIIIKTLVLLAKYHAPSFLIEKLLEQSPKFRHLFNNSLDLALQVLEATEELNDYERYN